MSGWSVRDGATLVVVRVLLVEDDEMLRPAVVRGLRAAGFAVDEAADGRTALDKVELTPYDVVVLDRDLPLMHGDEVCRTLIGRPEAPRVLMLTAFSQVEDRVDGLRLGADDYLTKPFAMSELTARVEALGRRPVVVTPPVLRHADVELDPSTRLVHRGGEVIHLTRKEFEVLRVLLTAAPAVVSAEELLTRVWDEHADPFTNAVRVTMTTLRKKLGTPPIITTIVGAGYRIE